MRRIWLMALTAALLTTACRMEMNVLIDINADRSGTFGFEIGMDDELRALVAAEGGEFGFGDLLDGLGTEVPGATVTERTEGDMTFTGAAFEFANETEFQEVIAAGAEGGDITVVWTEDTVTINAVLEGTGGGFGLGDLGDAAGGFDLESGITDFADNFFAGNVIIGMPGVVTSHNADGTTDDGKLRWDLKLDGSNIEIFAVSDLSGGSDFPAWALVALVVIAIAVLGWLIAMQRRRAASLAAVGAADDAKPPAPPAGWTETVPPAPTGDTPTD